MSLRPNFSRLMFLAVWAVFLSAADRAWAGMVTYNVTVDTSSFSGTQGSLEFQMIGQSGAGAVTASITNFLGSMDSSLPLDSISPPNPDISGAVMGSLNALPLTIGNASVFNDAVQSFNFGSSFSLSVALSGTDVGQASSDAGTTFLMAVWNGRDATGAQLLTFSGNGDGSALHLDITPSTGSTSESSDGVNVLATLAPQPSGVPEPSSIAMALLASAGLALVRCRRRCLGKKGDGFGMVGTLAGNSEEPL